MLRKPSRWLAAFKEENVRKSVHSAIHCLVAVCLLNANCNLFAQAPKRLTSADLVQMKAAFPMKSAFMPR